MYPGPTPPIWQYEKDEHVQKKKKKKRPLFFLKIK